MESSLQKFTDFSSGEHESAKFISWKTIQQISLCHTLSFLASVLLLSVSQQIDSSSFKDEYQEHVLLKSAVLKIMS